MAAGVVHPERRDHRWSRRFAGRRLPLVLVAALLLVLAQAPGLLWRGASAQAAGGHAGRAYVMVDDHTQIALAIWYPPGFDATDRHKWPALFEMDGYGGYPNPDDNEFFGKTDKYVDVYAQIRGTGCSGGQFDLFSERSALDGRYIIDNWIAKQPWSTGVVGITGHSYSGLTGFLVAATHPSHVKATAVSGLIDDFYRSILYPGGIFNEGFPVLWGALVRPSSEFSGNTSNYGDPQSAANQVQHQGTDTIPANLIVPTYTQMTAAANTWAIEHSLINAEPGIRAPIQINQQYQDEQTGPRGGYILWQHVPAGLPKRLILSNGQHNPNDAAGDKGAWLDCWLLASGHGCGAVTDPAQRVKMYFESRVGGPEGQLRDVPYVTSDWPAPETNWQVYYLRADHTLGTSAGGDGQVQYVSTSTDGHTTGTLGNPAGAVPSSDNVGQLTFVDGPNEARFSLPFGTTTALAGPIEMNLWLKSSAPDTDVFVDLLDYNPKTGQMAYLQRGLLRASFRAIDPARSDRVKTGPLAGTIYRPYHPFLERQLMSPSQAYQLPIEIFPLGHVFHAGHQLIVDIHAPPANDPISTYAYAPEQAPAVNTILQDAQHRSTLLVPLLPTLPPLWPDGPTPCGQIAGYVCFTPPASPGAAG